MPYVYLGFIEMLQNILRGIFDKVLSPVLETVFYALLDLVGGFLWEMLSGLLMDGFIILLKAVNFLNNMFTLFSGLGQIYDSEKQPISSLLEYVFQLKGVSSALAAMTILGTVMAFLFALYATGKSMADTPFEDNAFPVTQVLKNGFRSAITFMIVPFMSIFLLNFSGAILDQTIYSFRFASEETSNTGMDDTLFITAAQGAIKKSNKEEIIKKYSQNHAYEDRDAIVEDFQVSKINFVVGYTSCILVILILLGSCLEFIRRIFDLLILYLVSPFFSATIALDGGTRFKKWQDLFVAKFFSGFGAIFAMKIYIMAAPRLMSSDLKLSPNSEVDMLIKMFLVIGGAWAVFKGQHLMLQILNPEVANAASESGAVMKGLAIGGIARVRTGAIKMTTKIAGGATGKAVGNAQKGAGGAQGASSGGTDSQAFRGGKV